MNTARAVAIQIELQSRVIDLLSMSKTFHLTSAEIHARYHKLFERYPADLPQTVRAYIRGYYSALKDSLYHTHLVHGWAFEGLFYFQEWEKLPPAVQEAIKTNNVDAAGHYWKDTINTRAEDVRPFFISQLPL